MSLMKVFELAGAGMNAQSLRLNVIASNLANADAVSSSSGETYRARHVVFAAGMPEFDEVFASELQDGPGLAKVTVAGIVESQAPARRDYRPQHPLADEEGYVALPNVNPIEQMTDMISASRSYQTNAELINTSKQLLMRTLTLGQ